MIPNSSTNEAAPGSAAAVSEIAEAPPVRASAWEIARTFNEISLSSFGGGLSAWSREMVVARKKWMDDAEFLSAMTVCRILPGANQVNLAVFVGTKLGGMRGAGAALAGLIAMPTLLLVAIAALYAAFQHSHAVQHVLAGFAAAAVAMTLQMVWKTGRSTLTSVVPILLFAVTFLLNGVLRWPLWWTLAATAPFGIAWAWRRAHKKAAATAAKAAS
ncbi:chromate transporter [Acidisoma sp. 7E03]